MLKTLFLFISTFSILGFTTSEPSKNFLDLDNYFEHIGSNKKAMGETVILHNNKIIYKKNYGFMNQDVDSIYRIGSISKVYTSVLILKSVENNQLKLDTTLNTYFPKLPNSHLITIEHLLRHRSGLVNYTNHEVFNKNHESKQSRQDILKIITDLGTHFEPDKMFSYSNTGYMVLSFILEEIHNKSYAQILREQISIPYNLNNTFVYEQEFPKTNEVVSYQYQGQWSEHTNTHQTFALGAGAIASTAEEVSLFLKLLFNNKIINESSTLKMKTLVDKYGLGLIQVPYNDQFGIGHNGSIDSFGSQAYYFEKDNFIIVNLTNALNINFNNILLTTLGSFYNLPSKIPNFPSEVNVPISILQKYEGFYTSEESPLEITIILKKGLLYAKANEQPVFYIDPISQTEFEFAKAGIKFKFDAKENQMTLNLNGQIFNFKKK